jgi:hypothetical protein
MAEEFRAGPIFIGFAIGLEKIFRLSSLGFLVSSEKGVRCRSFDWSAADPERRLHHALCDR